MKNPSAAQTDAGRRRSASKQIFHAIQVYDLEKLGFPIAVFEGAGHFQDIGKGDTMDGRCWPTINDHINYAKLYRVISIRHTLTTEPDGSVKHLKSLFVEAVLASSSSREATRDGAANQ